MVSGRAERMRSSAPTNKIFVSLSLPVQSSRSRGRGLFLGDGDGRGRVEAEALGVEGTSRRRRGPTRRSERAGAGRCRRGRGRPWRASRDRARRRACSRRGRGRRPARTRSRASRALDEASDRTASSRAPREARSRRSNRWRRLCRLLRLLARTDCTVCAARERHGLALPDRQRQLDEVVVGAERGRRVGPLDGELPLGADRDDSGVGLAPDRRGEPPVRGQTQGVTLVRDPEAQREEHALRLVAVELAERRGRGARPCCPHARATSLGPARRRRLRSSRRRARRAALRPRCRAFLGHLRLPGCPASHRGGGCAPPSAAHGAAPSIAGGVGSCTMT